jgi:hypothetical protein
MTEAQKTETKHGAPAPASDKPLIHRVCIQCNNMFPVSADNYEAKQCPNCHKG